MPFPLQFAFQGGGARLALLLPVVQAIRDCEQEGILRVTRVAGTSAGAVAAALVAGKGAMGPLIENLRETAIHRPDVIRALFPSTNRDAGRISKIVHRLNVLWQIGVWNQPLASEAKFAEFLTKCLKKAAIDPSMSVADLDATCPIVVTYTDVVDKSGGVAAQDSKLLQVLIDSCALPFVFRTSGSKLDGGIVDNLPIDYLDNREKMGQVLAVGFREDAYCSPSKGAFSLAGSLLDAAMTSKTRSTKRVLGPNYVLELSPDAGDEITVDSFDVEGFIRFMSSKNAYDIRYRQAVDWIKQRVGELKEQDNKITLRPRVFSNPETMFDQLEQYFGSVNKIAQAYSKYENATIAKSTFDVIAHSLTDKTKNDLVRTADTLRVDSGVLNIYSTKLICSNSIDAGNVEFFVEDREGAAVDFAVLTVPEIGKRSRMCVIVFLTPLVADDHQPEVTIIQEQSVPNFMEPLQTHGSDYNGIIVTKALTAEKAEIGLAVPGDFPALTLYDGTPDTMRTHDIPEDAMARELKLNHCPGRQINRRIKGAPPQYTTYAWEGTDLKQGDVLRVVYRRQRA